MDEYLVCERMKERVCFCAADFKVAMAKKENYSVNYVLPNYAANRPGRVAKPDEQLDPDNEQFVRLKTERFQVPEILFTPSDAQINQVGK